MSKKKNVSNTKVSTQQHQGGTLTIDLNRLMQAQTRGAALNAISHFESSGYVLQQRMISSPDPRMVKPYCWMCNSNSGGKTREHIFSSVIRKVASENIFSSHLVNVVTGEGYAHRREQVLDTLLAGNVCGSCNSGWMSALEVSIAPKIVDMPDRKLTVHETKLLIRWIAKISVMMNTSQNYRVQWKETQRHALKFGLPDNMHVFITRVADDKKYDINWMQTIGCRLKCHCGKMHSHLAEIQEYQLGHVIRIFDLCFVVVLTPPNFKIKKNRFWNIDFVSLFSNGTLNTVNMQELPILTKHVDEEVFIQILQSFDLIER